MNLGERAFEIVLARKMARGEVETQWFERHGSTPITELPDHWPAEYRAMVERRIEVIESNRYLALIERPECKRRWATEGWDTMRDKALRDWLLDRCEARELWYHYVDGVEQPRPMSVNQLADELRRDPDVLAVAELYAPGKDLAKVLADLIDHEHVPYLAALRYKPSGLAKRQDWEYVWDKQREEDAAPDEATKKKIRDSIPVPPKYTSGDFLKPSYWRNRGKLDVPKERFISYPHAGRDGDPSLLIGWAGWNHREQAQALATLIVNRENEDGWGAERLAPPARRPARGAAVGPPVARRVRPGHRRLPRRHLRRLPRGDLQPAPPHHRRPDQLAPAGDKTRKAKGLKVSSIRFTCMQPIAMARRLLTAAGRRTRQVHVTIGP